MGKTGAWRRLAGRRPTATASQTVPDCAVNRRVLRYRRVVRDVHDSDDQHLHDHDEHDHGRETTTTATPRFVDNGDATITDSETGLVGKEDRYADRLRRCDL
jgi:hypothetical protein